MSAGLNENQELFLTWTGLIITLLAPLAFGFFILNDLNYGILLSIMAFLLFITLPLSYIPYVGWIIYSVINYLFILPSLFAMIGLKWSQEVIMIFIIYIVASLIMNYYVVAGKNKYEGFM